MKPSTAKALLPVILVLLLGLGGWAFLDTFSNVGYAPKQPIAYSHLTHAGHYRIPCLYCHYNAERSRHATVPAMNVCMNCHSVAGTSLPDVQTLTSLYNNGTTIQWKRIYRLPDYVYFSHRWHVAKGYTCQQCHGLVDSLVVQTQIPNLKMGWCISCHRKDNGPTECNTCHM